MFPRRRWHLATLVDSIVRSSGRLREKKSSVREERRGAGVCVVSGRARHQRSRDCVRMYGLHKQLHCSRASHLLVAVLFALPAHAAAARRTHARSTAHDPPQNANTSALAKLTQLACLGRRWPCNDTPRLGPKRRGWCRSMTSRLLGRLIFEPRVLSRFAPHCWALRPRRRSGHAGQRIGVLPHPAPLACAAPSAKWQRRHRRPTACPDERDEQTMSQNGETGPLTGRAHLAGPGRRATQPPVTSAGPVLGAVRK